MNRTNSLIIFASLLLGTFFVFNTTTMINVSAVEDKELSYYPPEYNPAIYDKYESRYYEDRYGKSYYIE